MKTIKAMLLGILLLVSGWASAMDGVFDRSVEVAQYVHLMKVARRIDVQDASKEIYVSGITDPKLAEAMKDRLLKELGDPPGSAHPNIKYVIWIAKALASSGIERYAETLQDLTNNSSMPKFNRYVVEEIKMIPWHHAKNEIMASRQYHHEDDDPRESQLLNLIMADAPSMKLFALGRIGSERRVTPRLVEAMAIQVKRSLESGEVRPSSPEDEVMARFVRLIGHSNDVKYQSLLEEAAQSANMSPNVQRQAQAALKRLGQ